MDESPLLEVQELGYSYGKLLPYGTPGFIAFGAGTLNLFFLVRANGMFLLDNGWMAVIDGGLRQSIEQSFKALAPALAPELDLTALGERMGPARGQGLDAVGASQRCLEGGRVLADRAGPSPSVDHLGAGRLQQAFGAQQGQRRCHLAAE